jgi:hypothetical protein
MAQKGDRERLEPVARQMYVDGKTLTSIEEILGVSRNTLADWREWGGWDRAKAAKDNYEAQLVTVRDTIMEQVAVAPLQAASYLDSLSKIDSILDRRARNAREAAEAIAKQKGEMFLAVVRDLIEYGRINAPDLLAALEENFDEVIQFGREKYAAS